MITLRGIEWIAGFLEGEGSFSSKSSGSRKRPYRNSEIQATQLQRWPLDKLVSLIGGTICLSKGKYWRWSGSGGLARGLAMTIYSLMSLRRQEQIRIMLQRDETKSPKQLSDARGKGFREYHTSRRSTEA